MLRIDRDVVPTMAKTPTLGRWELDLLRTIERVVRLGHIRNVNRGEIVVRRWLDPAGARLTHRPLRGLGAQLSAVGPRSGGPTRSDFRRSGPASPASVRHWPATWRPPATTIGSATGCVRRTRSGNSPPTGRRCRCAAPLRRATFGAEPDIATWANQCALNPARVSAEQLDLPAVQAARARLADLAEPGLAALFALAESR